jgi:glycosyltransferase involved in cell wall biosynthesis
MLDKKIKVTFVLPSLAAGGAERILSYVAKHIDTNRFESTLLITGFKKDTVYQLDDLKIIYLNKPRVLKSFFSLFHYFRKTKPDVVVSSIVHINTLIAFLSVFFPKIKIISREASILTVLNEVSPYTKSIFPTFMIVQAYKLVDCIICQSKDMQNDMVSHFKVPIKKTVLINNPITEVYPVKSKTNSSKPIRFITIGRLSKEKGYDRIIRVLSKLEFPFQYTIIGDGSEKEAIFELIKKHGIDESINYISFTNDVTKYLSESDLFLQGSYVEGFPNVLLESNIVGTPALAFNAPGGLSEIVQDGINGFVVNSEEEFEQCLIELNKTFNFNPIAVSDLVKERFNSKKILNKYEQLFLNIFNK